MDNDDPPTGFGTVFRRSYAWLAARMVRDNRTPEPGRLPAPPRVDRPNRFPDKPRRPAPPRP